MGIYKNRRLPQVSPEDIRFAFLAMGLLPGSVTVLYPSRALKSMGMYFGRELGRFPERSRNGGGQWYFHRYRRPLLLKQSPRDEQAREFDRLSKIYDGLIGVSSVPVLEEGIRLVSLLARQNSRILDLSCGPGTEIPALAALVPRGEVVGVDLAAGMVVASYERARREGVSNAAFIQADALKLPSDFTGRFDLIFCCNSFHHYPDPLAALKEMHRVLRVDGKAIIIDPRLAQFFLITEPISKWGDPGFVGFYSPEEFHRLFMTANFDSFYWNEMLPCLGVSIGTK
jgi:ubiquinone/menaquinone biosynthesis C-methylase UbiE